MSRFVVQWYSSAIGWYDVKEVSREEATKITNRSYDGERVVERN